MATMERIHHRLSTVFPENQAQVLTEVIWESKEDLATKSDFSELKGVVGELGMKVNELAEAQKRTEYRVEELADAQKRTEHRVDNIAMSLERLANAQERTEIAMGNLARQVGGLSEAFGGTLEDYALDLVPEVLENHWGLKTEEAYRKEFSLPGKHFEIDLIIRGKIADKPILVLGEVKSNLTKREVEKFIRTVEELKMGALDELQSCEIRILFFGYRANSEAMEWVRENNCYMVSTRGKIL